MKKMLLAGSLVLALVALSGCASGQGSKKASANTGAPRYADNVSLTGSYLGQSVARNGLITDGVSPVTVIDADMIRQSGASDARDLMRRYGAGR